MKKILYDEVPFSRDYNYDKLTNSEASEVFLTINEKKQDDYKYIAGTVVKCTLLFIVCSLSIYVTIFVLDWHNIIEQFSTPPYSRVVYQKIFSVFINFTTLSFCIKEIKFWIKFRTVHRKFLIAKGNIADVQKNNIRPDVFHPDGVKALLTVAVSDSEALPPLDVSLYRYDDVIIGDSIIIIYFPKEPIHIYLYEPWGQSHE